MYKWFLAWRYLNAKNQPWVAKVISVVAIGSVMLCVAMVLVVLSVMGGFLDTIRARSRGLHSEIVLEGGSLQGFPYYEEFAAHLASELPDIVRISTPVIYTYGIFRVPATTFTKPARVLGIRFKDYVQVNDFKTGLHYEHFFPGTTELGPQGIPVAGYTADGEIKLPLQLAAANAQWRKNETDLEAVAEFDQMPFEKAFFPNVTSLPGQRVFAVSADEPAYLGPERNGIIVGCDLLHYRRTDGKFDRTIARGADIALTLMPLSPSGNPTGEPPVRLPLRYADDSRTGIYEIDSLCVYVDHDHLQQQMAMDAQPLVDGGFTKPRINQLLIGLQPGVELNTAKDRIASAWSRFAGSLGPGLAEADERAVSFVDVYTWEDLQRQFIQAVEKEKVLVTFLFGLISMVAIVLVGCIFYMIVEKKTKDIGILKALGAPGRGIGGLFIAYAAAVGIFGSILGLLVGSVFVWNINAIQDFLATLNPQLRVWSPDVYSFDRIPEVVKQADAFWVAIIAILSSMVGSLIPAFIAARVWPVQALRYE